MLPRYDLAADGGSTQTSITCCGGKVRRSATWHPLVMDRSLAATSNGADLVVAGTSWLPEPDGELVDRLTEMLQLAHARNAMAAINGPDEHGAFRSPAFAGGALGRGVPPIVADASILRDDVLYACRNERRTVLVNAANVGATRVYCAAHVVDEVGEHAPRWTDEAGDVPHRRFVGRWTREYLPVMRGMRDEDVPLDILSPAERARIADLQAVDPDDVPSATLALALGAFYLSEDSRALRAVYGANFDVEGHRAWVNALKAGGDAGELGAMMFGLVMVPTVAGAGLFELGRWLSAKFSPWVLLPLALATVLGWDQIPPERRKQLGAGLSSAATSFTHLYASYEGAFERFRQAAPPIPRWTDLAQTAKHPRMVLLRACLHELARAPTSLLSAHELARALPPLGIGQGEQLVRETLRRHSCFDQPYQGQWQVGHAHPVDVESHQRPAHEPVEGRA